MTKKRIIITILGGMMTGGLTAAASCFPEQPALIAVFVAGNALAGALIAYFGGE